MTANPSETHWQHRADEIANALAALRTQHAALQAAHNTLLAERAADTHTEGK